MKNWVDVARPHEDILRGDLEMAVFAADLGSVARPSGSARDVYADPASFFKATYLTSSMRELLADVAGALAGEGGDRVLQLRTPFGGGKTHSLLALYHLITARDRLGEFEELRDLPNPGECDVAVLSGVDLDPSSPREHDGIVARTLWGELAWQLGGREAFDRVSLQDERGQAPGKDKLSELLPPEKPALLLLDEVLVYTEKAKAIRVGDTTLGSQVLLFLQALTELVGAHPRAAMVYSLQKSVLEAAGDESLLIALDHLVARVDAKREPVSGDEVMRVVQRRLFSDFGPEEERLEVARESAELLRRYRRLMAETDEERRNAESEADRFAERVMASYPFHPSLLDLMHQRWTTLPTYQRTRGALQFLATIVHGLWQGDHEPLPLIGPGDAPFADEKVRGAFFSQVGDREGFTGVLERDLIGANAGVKEIDRRLGAESRRLARLRVATRVASAIMLYSFGGRTDEEKGVLENELLTGLLARDLDRNVLTTALSDLREELLFLHYTGRRYRFDKTPNLNQLLTTEAEKFEASEVVDHVRKELERRIGATGEALLWPRDGSAIPDREPIFRVAYLDPQWASLPIAERDVRLRELFERRGGGGTRAYRNAIAFALPSREALEHARSAARRALAVASLVKQAKGLNIAGEQLAELRERGAAAERDLAATLERSYELVLLPVPSENGEAPYRFEEIDLSARLGLSRLLHDRVMEGLSTHVFERITPAKLAALLNIGEQDGQRPFLSCVEAVDAAFSFLQFPKLRSDSALRDCIARGVSESTFGYVPMAEATGDEVEVDVSLVRIGKHTGPDEIDLGAGAFVLAPEFARALLPEKVEPSAEPAVDPDLGPGRDKPHATPDGGRHLRISFTAEKTEIFDVLKMLPTLADESESLRLTATVEAEALDRYDQTWIRNVVEEPLGEAGAVADVELSE
ncbi:MAG: ATP-binding protein [Gaiellaceae bacterium]